MKQPWDIAHWLRSADFWINIAIFNADWKKPAEVVAALQHYSDAIHEAVL